jgi:hypothetical protein
MLWPLAGLKLLDVYTGASAAYSLRQLSNSYTGSLVTVRRSVDNSEQGFNLMLYSFRQQRPAPLPNRIRLSNGFTRYAHQPPTAEEILDAGYVAYTEPAYDAATEQLLWVDGAYVIEALPPPIPTPRWVDFSAIVMSLPAINVMLGAVLQAAPGLYGGLVVGLQNASEGDSRVFLNSWNAAFAMGLLSAELITTVQEIAAEYDLPEAFIDALG